MMEYFPFAECFTSDCGPCNSKEDRKEQNELVTKASEYFEGFQALSNSSIESIYSLQEKGPLPHFMLMNHELINKFGEAKKIYRVFTKDPTKTDYHGVGWVVHDSFPCCMVCNNALLIANEPMESSSSGKHIKKRRIKAGVHDFLPTNCYACGNIVCQNFCTAEGYVNKFTQFGRLSVCIQCYWGQEIVELTYTFRALSLLDSFATFITTKPPSSSSLYPNNTMKKRYAAVHNNLHNKNNMPILLLDEEKEHITFPTNSSSTGNQQWQAYRHQMNTGNNNTNTIESDEEDSLDNISSIEEENGIIDLTKKAYLQHSQSSQSVHSFQIK